MIGYCGFDGDLLSRDAFAILKARHYGPRVLTDWLKCSRNTGKLSLVALACCLQPAGAHRDVFFSSSQKISDTSDFMHKGQSRGDRAFGMRLKLPSATWDRLWKSKLGASASL